LYAQDVLDIRIPNLDDLYPKSETRALFTRIHKAFRTYQTLAEEVSVIVGSGLLKTEMDSDRD
jgi:hypothetical protein